jgi:hypothetical protein
MEPSQTAQDQALIPSFLAIFAGGGALAWMFYQNGFVMLEQWFFYPSFGLFIFTSASLLLGLESKFRRLVWTTCMWWSGLWTIVFLGAFAFPPFSTLLVGALLEPMLIAGSIGPFTAGFLHFFMWACAKDVVKSLNTEVPEQ